MKVILNEQGFVDSYALIGGFGDDFNEVEVDAPENLDEFAKNYRSYYLADGALVNSAEKRLEIETECILCDLRRLRDKECFPYINRGELWYSRLSAEQKQELNTWYQAWLDVTETRVVPERPMWLIEN